MTFLVGISLFLLLVIQTLRLKRLRAAEIITLRRASAAQITELRVAVDRAEQRTDSLGQILDAVNEGIVVCDPAGRITLSSAAARVISHNPDAATAEEWAITNGLRYPSGQNVPPGAVPLTRALSGDANESAEFLLLGRNGANRIVEMSASLLRPAGGSAQNGAFAILREITGERAQSRLAEDARARAHELSALGRKIGTAVTASDAYDAVVEGARRIAEHSAIKVQVRLFGLREERQSITLLAAAPNDAHKSVRTKAPAPPLRWPFDAQSSLLWPVYVEKQPIVSADIAADERLNGDLEQSILSGSPSGPVTGSALLVPLLKNNVVIGHLSLICPTPNAFEDASLVADQTQLAALAALADASFALRDRVQMLSEAIALLSTLSRLVAAASPVAELADAITTAGATLFQAELCVLSLWETANDGSRVLRRQGRVYADACVAGGESGTDASCSVCDPVTRKAAESGKAASRVGVKNPPFGQCAFRAFSGQSGTHSVYAYPVRLGKNALGALTLYQSGSALLSGEQAALMETLATLAATGFGQHQRPG